MPGTVADGAKISKEPSTRFAGLTHIFTNGDGVQHVAASLTNVNDTEIKSQDKKQYDGGVDEKTLLLGHFRSPSGNLALRHASV